MPLYRYEALDRTGNKVVGAMNAADENTLTLRLSTMGYQPLVVQAPNGAGRAARPASGPAASVPGGVPTSPLAADPRSIARMFHQLHISIRSGMPAYQAVTTVQGQVHHPALREALGEIADGVRDGQALSQLMERFPRLFSPGDVGTVRAAETGGFLPEALQTMADRYEQDDNARRRLRIWAWFLHVNVLAFFFVAPWGFFFRAAIENMDFFAGLRAVGMGMLWITLPGWAVYCGFLIWFYHARQNPRLAYRWHRILLRLPVVGKINHLRGNAAFTRTLQYLSRAGVMPSFAWQTAAGAVPNLVLAEKFDRATGAVESTSRFSTAMMQVGLLDPTDAGMVATGEASGEVDQALRYLADRYEEDTRVALGASVVRGAISFVTWSFLATGIALVILAQGYYGTIFTAVEKAFGVGE